MELPEQVSKPSAHKATERKARRAGILLAQPQASAAGLGKENARNLRAEGLTQGGLKAGHNAHVIAW